MTGDVENSPDPLGVQYVGPVGGDMHQVTVNGQTSYVPTSTVTSIPALAQGMTDRLAAAQAQSVSGVPSGVVPKPLAANPQPAGDYWSDPSRYNAAPAPVGAGNDNLNAPAPVPNLGKTAPVTQPNAAPVEPGGPPREQQTGPVATPTPTAATPTRAGAGGGDRTPSWIKSALGQEKDEASDALAASNTEYGLTKDLSAGRAKALQDEQADLAANETGRLADEQDAQRGAQDALDRAKQVADKWTNAKIDPENYWHSKDTAHQILAGLGMLVSGFGAGLAHQDNLAIKGMEDAQNRDLEAQKYNINHGKEASDVYRSIFQDYQAAGLSKDHAHQAAALTIKEKSLAAQDLDVAQHGGQVALLKFQQETAGQRKSLADQQLELGKTVDQHLQSQAATSNLRANTAHTYAETAQMGAGQTSALALRTGQANLAKGVKFAQLPPDQKQALISGASANETLLPNQGIAQRKITPEEHTQVQALGSVKENLKRLDKLARGGPLKGPAELAEANSLATTIQTQLPAAFGSKAKISEGTQDALSKIISDPGRNLLGVHQKVSSELKKSLQTVESSLHSDLGLTPFAESPDEAQAAALGATPAS